MRFLLPLLLTAQILAVDLPRPLELGQEAVKVVLVSAEDEETLRRVGAIAADPDQKLVLRLTGIEADEEPGASWEVYVASSDEEDCDNFPRLVGIMSLYGAGPDVEFVFALDEAIAAGEPAGLEIIFQPTSGLEVDGRPVPPTVRAPARIGGISLEAESLEPEG